MISNEVTPTNDCLVVPPTCQQIRLPHRKNGAAGTKLFADVMLGVAVRKGTRRVAPSRGDNYGLHDGWRGLPVMCQSKGWGILFRRLRHRNIVLGSGHKTTIKS